MKRTNFSTKLKQFPHSCTVPSESLIIPSQLHYLLCFTSFLYIPEYGFKLMFSIYLHLFSCSSVVWGFFAILFFPEVRKHKLSNILKSSITIHIIIIAEWFFHLKNHQIKLFVEPCNKTFLIFPKAIRFSHTLSLYFQLWLWTNAVDSCSYCPFVGFPL